MLYISSVAEKSKVPLPCSQCFAVPSWTGTLWPGNCATTTVRPTPTLPALLPHCAAGLVLTKWGGSLHGGTTQHTNIKLCSCFNVRNKKQKSARAWQNNIGEGNVQKLKKTGGKSWPSQNWRSGKSAYCLHKEHGVKKRCNKAYRSFFLYIYLNCTQCDNSNQNLMKAGS